MNDSILTSIKKLLGITADYTVFDPDIVLHINSVFFILRQLGVGPESGYSITGATDRWSDYLSDISMLESVRTLVYLRVRVLFDPPQNGTLMQALKDNIAELEWRLNSEVDPAFHSEGV